jgi:hypothetical protein
MTDHLEADSITIPGQNYALINVVSPTSNQKTKECALKIKGVFATIIEAKEYASKISKTDPTFDLFVVELYKWLPIPPTVDEIADQQYQDEKLNTLISEHKNEQIRAKEFFESRKGDLINGGVEPNDQQLSDDKSPLEVDISTPTDKIPSLDISQAVKAQLDLQD